MQPKVNILFIEDERNILTFVTKLLYGHNYKVTTAITGTGGLQLINSICPDLILLDLGLPDMDGQTIIQQVREWSDCSIIVISARTNEHEKVKALDLGAEDYITKPFGIMELLSRVKAVLRRSHVQKPEQQQVLSAHDLTIDLNQRTVVYLETEIVLTYKEFELLSYLVRNRGSAISRDRLLEQVWGFSYEGETRTVDAHVKTLRQKLEAAGCTNLIHTVRGYGYKIGG